MRRRLILMVTGASFGALGVMAASGVSLAAALTGMNPAF